MDIAIALSPHSAIPLHRQLYEELRRAILSGRLLPQQRLPSTRELAKSLGVSRTTVTLGYEQLLSEGYLKTIIGSGTFVCAQIPDDLLQSTPTEAGEKAAHFPISLSQYGEQLAQTDLSLQAEPQAEISFRYGRPACDRFPLELWRKLLARYCRTDYQWLDYAFDPLGYLPLREAIALYLGRSRAVQCNSDQILLTNGTQQALYLISRLLLNTGDAIALEDPGYLSARRIFSSQGANIFPIPVDESGLRVAQLIDKPVKLVYVTPSHQFPTGAILSLPRRLELLAWAQQTGALIIEDDYDSEYRYGERPIPALQGLAITDSVLYIGTFSKVLFPSLRIGYLVLPKSLVSIFARAKWLSDRQLPSLEQRVLADFIAEGHLERHLRQMRSHYNQLRQVLVEALKRYFGDRATILGENAGIHLMVRLHFNLSDDEILQRAAKVGVGLLSAQSHYFSIAEPGQFIFGYSELTQTQIQTGIRRLAMALEEIN
ncbi:PLP-dependent aminotransferase family protein [Desertifilum sp. FACHB-1129]|uniref:Aspartate aminotransferase n=2 Tax=Desertifilum tharense IPPAS B-1220 TaxID=1781255 RepID=A0A1E5QPF1_9CYAN|nr:MULTISPECIES: PLP-dependent aminotransferase family protein [Desertifilum]MDA0211039.1 PLP-dependent aminotransferase family protein [Cyanobacteria bacterium FC1]MBD2312707.1 PLP-dependent aminotransferase family protein [Desertifilum sp. FACHB-1129]MBD2320188.1 PLP-dependent aminotransferase family protein [Desertifilum sp. FACHB-866]MBD2330316.1 PLP-dependent aminotransferase family protein [Desertifilum sp. FACHB-868]OEJ76501.1 aspartate aminotransferase [Desertifilum tharense IPPAS B-12